MVNEVLSKVDSLSAINANYVEILEKTNQQLSLWWNPYGVMVGALGILIALIAIGTAYAIYRQSNDYKVKLEKDRQRHIEIRQQFEDDIKKFLDEQKTIILENQEKANKISNNIDTLV